MADTSEPRLPNQVENVTSTTRDPEILRRRVRELEELCAELYEAGVVLGLPQSFLNKLWMVAAHGNAPHTFEVAITPGPDAPPLPDVRLVHDPASPRPPVPLAPLAPIPIRRTVLVVDDDPAILQIVLKILSFENYEVLSAASGPLALNAVEQLRTPLDLLITDYVMPGMNGRELATALRARYVDLKVLYQTGFTDLLFAGRPEVEANAAFIEKPFSARGLQEAARLLLFKTIDPAALQLA